VRLAYTLAPLSNPPTNISLNPFPFLSQSVIFLNITPQIQCLFLGSEFFSCPVGLNGAVGLESVFFFFPPQLVPVKFFPHPQVFPRPAEARQRMIRFLTPVFPLTPGLLTRILFFLVFPVASFRGFNLARGKLPLSSQQPTNYPVRDSPFLPLTNPPRQLLSLKNAHTTPLFFRHFFFPGSVKRQFPSTEGIASASWHSPLPSIDVTFLLSACGPSPSGTLLEPPPSAIQNIPLPTPPFFRIDCLGVPLQD